MSVRLEHLAVERDGRGQTGHTVEWRSISLRLVNNDVDDATDVPPECEHTAGLRVLRLAAAVRGDLCAEALGPLVTAVMTRHRCPE